MCIFDVGFDWNCFVSGSFLLHAFVASFGYHMAAFRGDLYYNYLLCWSPVSTVGFELTRMKTMAEQCVLRISHTCSFGKLHYDNIRNSGLGQVLDFLSRFAAESACIRSPCCSDLRCECGGIEWCCTPAPLATRCRSRTAGGSRVITSVELRWHAS